MSKASAVRNRLLAKLANKSEFEDNPSRIYFTSEAQSDAIKTVRIHPDGPCVPGYCDDPGQCEFNEKVTRFYTALTLARADKDHHLVPRGCKDIVKWVSGNFGEHWSTDEAPKLYREMMKHLDYFCAVEHEGQKTDIVIFGHLLESYKNQNKLSESFPSALRYMKAKVQRRDRSKITGKSAPLVQLFDSLADQMLYDFEAGMGLNDSSDEDVHEEENDDDEEDGAPLKCNNPSGCQFNDKVVKYYTVFTLAMADHDCTFVPRDCKDQDIGKWIAGNFGEHWSKDEAPELNAEMLEHLDYFYDEDIDEEADVVIFEHLLQRLKSQKRISEAFPTALRLVRAKLSRREPTAKWGTRQDDAEEENEDDSSDESGEDEEKMEVERNILLKTMIETLEKEVSISEDTNALIIR